MHPRGATLRQLPTADLTASELSALYALFSAAWPDGGFTDDDFAHGMGGMHWLAEVDGSIVSHASVVARRLEAGDRVLRTGYLEAVATQPRPSGGVTARWWSAPPRGTCCPGTSSGRSRPASPGSTSGWAGRPWLGPTSVRTPDGLQRTEDDDGGIFILRTPSTPALDLAGPLVCDWRSGDVW